MTRRGTLGEHITTCDHARVRLTTHDHTPRACAAPHTVAVTPGTVATKPTDGVADPSLCLKLTRPACVREARGRRRARQRCTGSDMLIIDGITQTDLTLDDVENALFPLTGLAPRPAPPRKRSR